MRSSMEKMKNILFNKKGIIRICQKFDLNLVVLFGSLSSEKPITKESDIDIGILCNNGKNILKNDLLIIQGFAEIFNDDRIDLTYLDYADPLFLFEIAQNGTLLYQDKEDRFAEFKIKAIKKYMDAEKFFKLEDLCLQRFLQKTNMTNDR